MLVHWTELADQDLKLIYAYIEHDNRTAALKVVTRIYNAVHTQLVTAPQLGRAGRVPKTRELVLSGIPYIIAYQISKNNDVIILRILHTSQRWPDKL